MKKIWTSRLTLLALLFGLIGFVIIMTNQITQLRVDLTEDQLYTLSQGTKTILAELDEPIKLEFYFSDTLAQPFPQLKTYARRIEELLREYERHAKGKLKIIRVHPEPFTDKEDDAMLLGLQGVPVSQQGDRLFFGISGTNTVDDQEVIAFLHPDQEKTIEYQLTKLIIDLSRPDKPTIGLITDMPVEGRLDPLTQQHQEPWVFMKELEALYKVERLKPTSMQLIPKEIETLLVIHPKDSSSQFLYALDQFVLRGGKLIAMVDPFPLLEQQQTSFGAVGSGDSSTLRALLKAWGVDYEPTQVVIDKEQALLVQNAHTGMPARHGAMLGIRNINPEVIATHNLDVVHLGAAGGFKVREDKTTEVTTLLMSSLDVSTVPREMLAELPDPEVLFDHFVPEDEPYHFGVQVTGKVDSIFKSDDAEAIAEKDHVHLTERDSVNVILFSDSDWLSDAFWVRVQNLFGQMLYEPFASNGALLVNMVEQMTGHENLISLRSRNDFERPFTAVDELRKEAQFALREQEKVLEQKLNETERALKGIESRRSEQSTFSLDSESEDALKNFLEEKKKIRKELRNVRYELNNQIDSLGMWIKLINIILMPSLFGLAAWFFLRRRRKQKIQRIES